MNRTLILGMVMIAVGCVFIALGFLARPVRTLQLVTGALFILSGVLRMQRSRRR